MNRKLLEAEMLEKRVMKLRREAEEEDAQMEALRRENDAYKNAYAAMWDGIKYVQAEGEYMTIALPCRVQANIRYQIGEGEEMRRYVCFKTGVVDADNLTDFLFDEDTPGV